MAQSPFSPTPSPGISSSHEVSDSSSDEELSTNGLAEAEYGSTSRAGSPLSVAGPEGEGEDTMSCQWEECGRVFNHLPSLITHIHEDHIGVHKSNYTCEWKTCPRRGIAQTSRFALISHIRSHTGEKPFVCPRPECDKSFTRSDALAKHMRIQHGIVPPAPGRGGNRKRKREEPEAHAQASAEGYSTFKVDPPEVPEFEDGPSLFELNEHTNGTTSRRSATPDLDDDDDFEDEIPPHLLEQMDKNTGLILGRTPTMVKYLVMKAKHQFVLEEHASLIEDLKMVRYEEKLWRERKDALLDEVLRATFGPQAEQLTLPSSDLQNSERLPSPEEA